MPNYELIEYWKIPYESNERNKEDIFTGEIPPPKRTQPANGRHSGCRIA